MTTTTPRPTDKELLWREERDQHGNSTFEALSYTWGDPNKEPCNLHAVQCVLRDNEAKWRVQAAGPWARHPSAPTDWEDRTNVKLFATIEDAQAHAQAIENDLREILGTDMPPMPERAPETAPLVTDEHGFAATTIVRPHWSRNQGRLHFTRVWKKTEGDIEQEREITDPAEETECLRGYFAQKMIEGVVTRLATGGFGRMEWETPFATVVMQCELDFLSVSAFTATIRRAGQPPQELALAVPTTQRIMTVVARQMHEREKELIAKVGNRTETELRAEIQRSARQLGLPIAPPAPEVEASEHGGILPVELGDIHAGGGDITNPGQLPRRNR